MRPEEAQIGKRVRVRNDHRKTDFRGREGTIAERWGDPGYPALDVLLDDGYWQLFWYHELEPVEGDDSGSRRQNRATVHGSPPKSRKAPSLAHPRPVTDTPPTYVVMPVRYARS